MTNPPKPATFLTAEERKAMQAETELAKSSAVEAIRERRRGTGHMAAAAVKVAAKVTRMLAIPDPDALPA